MPRLLRRTLLIFVLCGLLPLLSPAARAQEHSLPPVITVDHGPNAASQLDKHYVVLVSLDGFRWDYATKYGATHLLAIGAHGASAPEGMIPAYPSVTFPNHYTLVTGLYPEHHGIVANSFYDPARKQTFSPHDPATVRDGSWYGGVPLWSLAEKQGMRTACFFWPGSEAKIAGERPSYYLRYDSWYPDRKRIDQVIAWLKLPPVDRPHFITLYYASVDHEGHLHGPDSKQVRDAVRHMDALMGELEARLDALHLPIDLIVTSDHGMARVEGSPIVLDKFAGLHGFKTVGSLLYAPSEADAEHAYQQLKSADAGFQAFRRAKVPAELHYNGNPREGDPVIVAQGPYLIHARSYGGEGAAPMVGNHGYNPFAMKSMRAIFYAEGPDIRPGTKLKPFENVNVFPFIVKILGLRSGKVDGDANVLSIALRGKAAQ
ncbi:MAG: ectonucleotide pyrophosphatase/phosphodiesterase [Acidobacteriaceae bacterium]